MLSIRFRYDERWRPLGRASLVLASIALVGVVASFAAGAFGLGQRVLVGAEVAWLGAVAEWVRAAPPPTRLTRA